MGKMSELSLLLDEYREANRRAAELADEISAMLTGTEPPAHEAHEETKPLTLEEVRAVLADKSKDGFTAQIRELLKSTARTGCLPSTPQTIGHCLRMRRD